MGVGGGAAAAAATLAPPFPLGVDEAKFAAGDLFRLLLKGVEGNWLLTPPLTLTSFVDDVISELLVVVGVVATDVNGALLPSPLS